MSLIQEQINAVIARLNSIATSAKNIFQLPLTSGGGTKWIAVYNQTTGETERINLADITSQAGLPDGLVQSGVATIDEVEDEITFSSGYVVRIDGNLASNLSSVTIAIPLATDSRFDSFGMDENGNIIRIVGIDSETPVIPNLPDGLILIATILVSSTAIEPPVTPDLSGFIPKNSFAYLPLSSQAFAIVPPLSMNFVTTDGDGVSSFSGWEDVGVNLFVGKRMIIRNEKTTDFSLNVNGLKDATFAQSYIIKAGDNIEFDFTASGFRQVGIDAISRKGTAVGAPVKGDLEFEPYNYDLKGILSPKGDVTFGIFFDMGIDGNKKGFVGSSGGAQPYFEHEIDGDSDYVTFSKNEGLFSSFDYSQSNLNELKTFAQRSYVLGVPKSESFTAQNNGRYRTTATLTITDTETENYFVQVQSGVCTIGGVAYVAGDWIWRVGANSYKINGAGGGGGGGTWGSITGTLSDQTDLQTALDARILKAELTRTPTAGEIDTETIFSDRVVILDVGSTDTTINILTALNNVLFKKQGSGIVTFVSDTGRTLRTLTNNLNVLTADGGMALLFADGTTDNLYVNDGEQPALLKSGYRKGVILDTDFSTVSGTQVANVGFSEAYPDATYEIWLTFYRASGSLFSYHYVIPEASVTSTGFQLILQHGSTPTGLKIKYQTFRDE